MMRLMLALATATAVSACSKSRDRDTPAADKAANTARELRIARPDTAGPGDSLDFALRANQPVSSAEQQVTRNVPAPPARPKVRHPKRPITKSQDTAAVRGYAPSQRSDSAAPVRDSSIPVDTTVQPPVTVPPTDTTTLSTPDTAAASARPDTSSAAAPKPDTSTAVARDTSTSSQPDTAAQPSDTTTTPVDQSAASASRRTLPIGTEIHAALDDSINSRRDSAGRGVTAQVTENVTGAGGRILIPAGTIVHLTVTRLGSAQSRNSQGRLGLRVDGIQLGAALQKVQADVQAVPRELRGRGVTGKEAAKVGVGAAGGAVLGRVIGGNTRGAVIGGVVGAAGGAVVASQTATRDVVVKAKTPIVFVLTAPLVTP